MAFKSKLAIAAGKSAYWFLHNIMHGGTSLPGKITLSIDPDVLKELAKNYEIVIVTGTNGKTLTTALTVKVLKQKYPHILTNPSGSNMKQGIVSTFLSAKTKKDGKNVAVLETDEANVPIISQYVTPSTFVLTNIFRDQLDRFGEIYTTYNKILKGIKMHPQAKIIANGDEPLFNDLQSLPNQVVYFGFDDQPDKDQVAPANTDGVLCQNCNHILHFYSRSYGNLGKYYCPHCGLNRPQLTYRMTQIVDQTPQSSTVKIEGHEFTLHIGGTYNIYNALAAYAVGAEFGLLPHEITKALGADDKNIFGRQEVVHIGDKDVTIILVKNPIGLDQVLQMIKTDKDPFSLAFLLNANYADGIDTSWIWDGSFEELPFDHIPSVLTGGERYKDITFRMRVAGVPEEKFAQRQDLKEAVDYIQHMPTKKVYVLATYTAMLQLRKMLADEGYIKGGMD